MPLLALGSNGARNVCLRWRCFRGEHIAEQQRVERLPIRQGVERGRRLAHDLQVAGAAGEFARRAQALPGTVALSLGRGSLEGLATGQQKPRHERPVVR